MALFVTVGLPAAAYWELAHGGYPYPLNLLRVALHELLPLFLFTSFLSLVTPEVGYRRWHALAALVPIVSAPFVVRCLWRAAHLPNAYWRQEWLP